MLHSISLSKKPKKLKLSLHKPNRDKIRNIVDFSNESFNFSLSDLSTLSFQVPYFVEREHELITNKLIAELRERFLIKLQWNNVTEWYMITELSDSSDDSGDSKQVTAKSLEYELSDKLISELNVTSYSPSQILDEALKDTIWSTGTIYSEITTKARSFDVSEVTTLDFLSQIADTFGVMVTFDTENRRVNLEHPDQLGINRGLRFSYGKYLKSVNKTSSSEEMVTRLKVFGKDGASIQSVNPTGANYIESFNYFIHPFERDVNKNVIKSSYYMTDSLCNAILDYEVLVESKQGEFSSLLDQLKTKQTELTTKKNEKFTLDTELKTIQDTLDIQRSVKTLTIHNFTYNGTLTTKSATLKNTVDYVVMIKVSSITNLTIKLDGVSKTVTANTWTVLGKLDAKTTTSVELTGTGTNIVTSIYILEISSTEYSTTGNEAELINKYNDNYKQAQVDTKQVEIDNVNSEITNINGQITTLKNTLSIANNFTPTQIQERNQYIIERKWSDDYYIEVQELYDDAKLKFEDIRKPKVTIDIDIVNFLELIEEQRNWDKLYLGDSILIYHEILGFNIRALISDISYSNGEISLTISDIEEIKKKDRLLDMIKKSYSSSTSVDMNKYKWNKTVTDLGEVNDIIENTWDATKRRIVAGASESVEIGERGIIVRNPNFPNDILILQAGVIALSKDGGQTWTTAVTPSSVVAEAIMGKLIAGVNLTIENEEGKFTFNSEGATIQGASFNLIGGQNGISIDSTNGMTVTKSDNKTKVIMNATDGIKIQTSSDNGSTWTDNLTVDTNGQIVAKKLTVKRPDGFSVVNDGYANFSFNVFPAYPDFVHPEIELYNFNGAVYRTNYTTEHRAIGFFNYRHEARYLNLQLVTYVSDNVDNYSGGLIVRSEGVTLASKLFTNQGSTSVPASGEILTVDLGVPDGARKSFYIMIKSSSSTIYAYTRLLGAWLEG